MTYEIPYELIDQYPIAAELVFISRTVVNKDLQEYWPHQNGQERYLGYRIKATNWQEPLYAHVKGEGGLIHTYDDIIEEAMTTMLLGTHIRVGTRNELFTPKIW